MLFAGGLSGPIGLLLIGVAATAVLTLCGVIAASVSRQHSWSVHLIVAVIYLPILALVADSLPSSLSLSKAGTWLVFMLGSAAALLFHACLTFELRLRAEQRQSKGRSRHGDHGPALSREPPENAPLAHALANVSVGAYRDAVVSAEEDAHDYAFVQRRVAPYFNSDDMLRFIATQRFGAGNREADAYVSAHRRRRDAFFASLASGARYREMFERRALLSYVRTGTHSAEMWPLTPDTMLDLLENWRTALREQSNYYVGITDEAMPLKYHVIDNERLVLHEPIGKGDAIRFNSLFVYSRDIAEIVASDFELVWGLIDPEWRDRQRIAAWIQDELMPLARQREA